MYTFLTKDDYNLHTADGSWGVYHDDDQNHSIFGSESNPQSRLMQFTGKCDKKGKEIYEGDILSSTVLNEFGSSTAINLAVIWCDHEGNWAVTRTPDDLESEHFIMGGKVVEDEVIGNIYQNRDLLK